MSDNPRYRTKNRDADQNGQRMTPADKKHAILLALKTWPDKSSRTIAEQVGVNHDYVNDVRKQVSDTRQVPDRVTGKDGKSYPASRPDGPTIPKRAEIAAMVTARVASEFT